MRLVHWKSMAVAMALAVTTVAGMAEAQGNICVDLEARLVQLDRGAGGGTGGDPRQFDIPIARQRSEIDRAMAEARRSGCVGGFFIFQKTPAAKCGKLMATIDRMQNNLQRLMSERGQFGGDDPYTTAQERSDVLRGLAQNRCGPTYASNDEFAAPRAGLFASLFGPHIRTYEQGPFSSDAGFGTYRTLCVRTCDGFYFPISFSTVPSQFSTDADTCQAMCPGAEASLYTYRNPGEDTDQMVSLSGEAYTSLPTAFRFRTEYDRACTCHSAATGSGGFADFSPLGTLTDNTQALAAPAAPLPRLRPIPGEDPETIANRAAGLAPKPATPADSTESATRASADGQRKIRVVGPAYYYGQ